MYTPLAVLKIKGTKVDTLTSECRQNGVIRKIRLLVSLKVVSCYVLQDSE